MQMQSPERPPLDHGFVSKNYRYPPILCFYRLLFGSGKNLSLEGSRPGTIPGFFGKKYYYAHQKPRTATAGPGIRLKKLSISTSSAFLTIWNEFREKSEPGRITSGYNSGVFRQKVLLCRCKAPNGHRWTTDSSQKTIDIHLFCVSTDCYSDLGKI